MDEIQKKNENIKQKGSESNTKTETPQHQSNENKHNSEQGEPSNNVIEQGEPSNNVIEQATQALEGLKKQNEIMAENLRKAESFSVQNMMSGQATAGKEMSSEDRVTEKARQILKGTGYEDELFPQRQ